MGITENCSQPGDVSSRVDRAATPNIAVALLTGGGDKPYVYGLTTALAPQGAILDLIGSDELQFPEFCGDQRIKFLNLRGDQRPNVSLARKVCRIALYYTRLILYAARAKPTIFHILWNNKVEFFDRTLLMMYYKLLRKKLILTVHNVNAGKRDSKDSRLNRITLAFQYRVADHLFVHTNKMKQELVEEFKIQENKITVIPFGINNAISQTNLGSIQARKLLGIGLQERVMLFFGNITPYKGVEYLVTAFRDMLVQRDDYRLIIAGRPGTCHEYWKSIQEYIRERIPAGRVLLRTEFIPDEEAEVYFKAADVLVLPYKHVYQSGVLFTAHNFGLPVVAADVGSLSEDIAEGKNGFIFKAEDPVDLSRALDQYFSSDLYINLAAYREVIQRHATERHSWATVSRETMKVYAELLAGGSSPQRAVEPQPDTQQESAK